MPKLITKRERPPIWKPIFLMESALLFLPVVISVAAVAFIFTIPTPPVMPLSKPVPTSMAARPNVIQKDEPGVNTARIQTSKRTPPKTLTSLGKAATKKPQRLVPKQQIKLLPTPSLPAPSQRTKTPKPARSNNLKQLEQSLGIPL